MDTGFAVILYNTVREFHNRYRHVDNSQDKIMHKEEVLFYLAHLRTCTKHAKWLELLIDEKIAGAENAANPSGVSTRLD